MSDEIKIPSASVLRLQMGEMTAQEVRTAQAAYRLGYLAAIRAQETLATRCEARFNDDGTLDEVVGFGTFHLIRRADERIRGLEERIAGERKRRDELAAVVGVAP